MLVGVGNVDDLQVAPRFRLPEGDSGVSSTGEVVTGMPQDVLDREDVSVDVGGHEMGVELRPDRKELRRLTALVERADEIRERSVGEPVSIGREEHIVVDALRETISARLPQKAQAVAV